VRPARSPRSPWASQPAPDCHLGLGIASRGGDLSPREIELLRALRPAHLRADLHCLGKARW
jgi:hypothetical protein